MARNSIVQEKIKKNEIKKHFKEEYKNENSERMLNNLTNKIGLTNSKELEIYLSKYNLNLNFVKEKIKTEDMWNRIIYNKYKNQINIDLSGLKNKLKKQINNNNNVVTKYNLSEIQFNCL